MKYFAPLQNLAHPVRRSDSPAPPPAFEPVFSPRATVKRETVLLDKLDELEKISTEPEVTIKTDVDVKDEKVSVANSPPRKLTRDKTIPRIPEGQREAILALALRGDSPKKIAEVFGLNYNTVKGFIWKKKKEGLSTAAAAQLSSATTSPKKTSGYRKQ